MLDVKRKLETITSFMLPQSSPTVVQAIMKRVKGTDSWERSNLRKNTQENVAMVKDPEVKFCDYVKPPRKINAPRSPEADDAASSGTHTSFDSTEGNKSVQFDKFVEEISYLSCPPDAERVKESEECKAKVLAILGLEGCPLKKKGDAVIDAVCQARENCCPFPRIAMVPINDEGKPAGKVLTASKILGELERFPSVDSITEDGILSGASTSTDVDMVAEDIHSQDEDEREIIPIHIGDDEEDEVDLCPIRALAIEA